MGRQPTEPRYRPARDTWYAQVDGRQVTLAKGKANLREAKRALRRLLAERELAPAGRAEAPPVGALVTDYLEDLMGRRDRKEVGGQTKADAERRLAGFVEMHGALASDGIKPHHVDEWLATRAGWGKTSRHDGIGAVKSVFRWAARKGRIDRNPLAEMEKPKRAKRREVIPTPADVTRAFEGILVPELADLLAFVFETGCRPKEARTLEARHLDRANGVAAMSEHKTADKTGAKRVLYLTPKAAGIAYRLADLRPEGPIFLNSRGRPWTHNAVGLAVRRLRGRTGLGKEMVAYALRHAFATDALARKVPVALVAELMGHSDTRMMGTYSHISERHEALREAAERAKGSGGDTVKE